MEKADVLEMTVHYLRELKRREQKQKGTVQFIYVCDLGLAEVYELLTVRPHFR